MMRRMDDTEADGLGILPNHLKRSLARGGLALGTWVLTARDPAIIRMVAAARFDFVIIDTQHSSLSLETVADFCEMARACRLVPIVRPYDNAGSLVNRIQDLGAMGIMYPDITSRSQVDELVYNMLYPPLGCRGSTSLAAPMDYVQAPGDKTKEFINANMLMAIQVESRAGVEQIDEILAPGGVDLVDIGRSDLSTSYGVPFEVRHSLVLQAIDAVVRSCKRYGVAVGTNCRSMEDAADMVTRGVTCVSYSTDRHILVSAYAKAAEEFRSLKSGGTRGN